MERQGPGGGAITVAIGMTQCWHRVPGGTATSIVDLAAALDATGAVRVVGVGPRSGRGTPPEPPPVPVRHLPLPLPVLYDAWRWTGRPRVGRTVPEADLVHVTVPVPPPRERVPVVATVHDVLPLTHPDWFTSRGVALMRRGLEAIAASADAVVVPSEATRRACGEHGFDDERLHVVPWGSHPVPEVSVEEVRNLGDRHGIRPPYVCFVGTAEPRKGLSVLVDALVRLGRRDVPLVLAGPRGWGAAGLDRLGEVPGGVVELGHVPRRDLTALEAGAAVVALPSLAEGFGLPVLESMAAGAPVVTTSGTACGEVAGDGALTVPPGDATALGEAIGRLLVDESLAAELRDRGRRRAAGFTWSAAAEGVLAVYRSVLGGGAT